MDEEEEVENGLPGRLFVSRHRRTLDHIESDANKNRLHLVPGDHPRLQFDGDDNNHHVGGRGVAKTKKGNSTPARPSSCVPMSPIAPAMIV